MIRHICMFKLNNSEELPAILDRAQSLRKIPQIREFQLTVNDPRTPENNYDLALIFDFDSVEDLNLYRDSEIHRAFGKYITPLRDLRACIDYEF